MTMLRITAGPYTLVARWEEMDAPKTVDAIRRMLPLRSKLVHCRWSGESTWVPMGERRLGVSYENHTSHPAPGEMLVYPGGISEMEFLFPYGACLFSSKVGQLAGNHFATVTAVLRARERGASVTVETCPHYLVFSAEDVERVGPALKCAPPIRDASSRERLWQHVLAGEIDLVASDHSPCSAELKTRGDDDIWEAWGGVSGIQSFLPVMLSEGVHRRGLRLAALARLVAGAPARLLGLWPQKGAIRAGADADVALVALEREWTLDRGQLQARSGLSPYVGRSFRGAVVRTLVRGVTVFDEGEFVEDKGRIRFGRLVTRMGV